MRPKQAIDSPAWLAALVTGSFTLGVCRLQKESDGVELLCTVRGILKKIKQSVLVGDRVKVAGIDWDDMRGNSSRHLVSWAATSTNSVFLFGYVALRAVLKTSACFSLA